ncbi:ethylene-responsive-like protein [Corchorus olitorius]|uniref:Ethylene-responsive-like protein n=1 Tax=Corchorus olitorius TaxID=93759 RepID=A0A1R3IQB2_9ROSI|nr:ethylene-responsive-like protein [Corchorus olitorius]
MVARAHDVASMAIKGSLAYLNFPKSAHELPCLVTSSRRDIQEAGSASSQLVDNDQSMWFDLPNLSLEADSSQRFGYNSSWWQQAEIDIDIPFDETLTSWD